MNFQNLLHVMPSTGYVDYMLHQLHVLQTICSTCVTNLVTTSYIVNTSSIGVTGLVTTC
jgi:hypothetical protein